MNHTVFSALLNQGLRPGQIVLSKAGHDQNRVYLILEVDANFAVCVDGEYRPIDKPKRKRVSHLRPLGELPDDWQIPLKSLHDHGQQNALIRKLIKSHPGWSQPSADVADT
ncbi:MAG: KOW domain-containing RNA-binding protein [Eubacteriales bacterium]|nr:KOW domain-containing RNA-binding protein [Eubacteriales bacterium]